jgi:hypothetical protein
MGIKTTKWDVCKTQVMAIPTVCDDFTATVELYSAFVKHMKAENQQLNVSEVSFARGAKGGGKSSYGKRGFSGISNVSNSAVDNRFFEKHEYHALTPEQKNTLWLKRLKWGHVGNGQGGGGNSNGKGGDKGPTLKSLTRSIAAMGAKFDKFSIPNDEDEDESSEEEEVAYNRSNVTLTFQSKKKKRGVN